MEQEASANRYIEFPLCMIDVLVLYNRQKFITVYSVMYKLCTLMYMILCNILCDIIYFSFRCEISDVLLFFLLFFSSSIPFFLHNDAFSWA